MSADDTTRPRRQARGRRRIEEILRAAAAVFAERGYEATTTNAIAARAGISPGSLYQFFGSKDDIAHALAELYASRLADTRARAFGDDAPSNLPLPAIVDAIIDPVVEFNMDNPGFKALFARTDMPASLAEAVAPIHAAIHGRVTDLLLAVAPGMTTTRAAHATTVVVQLVRAMMPLITGADDTTRADYVADLKAILVDHVHRERAAAR